SSYGPREPKRGAYGCPVFSRQLAPCYRLAGRPYPHLGGRALVLSNGISQEKEGGSCCDRVFSLRERNGCRRRRRGGLPVGPCRGRAAASGLIDFSARLRAVNAWTAQARW